MLASPVSDVRVTPVRARSPASSARGPKPELVLATLAPRSPPNRPPLPLLCLAPPSNDARGGASAPPSSPDGDGSSSADAAGGEPNGGAPAVSPL
jgi:hypothetical protein